MAGRYDIRPEVVRDLAASLGHRDLLVRPTRRERWVCECACGFISRSVLRPAFAAEEGMKHLENSIREAQRSGQADRFVDTPEPEQSSERRRGHVA